MLMPCWTPDISDFWVVILPIMLYYIFVKSCSQLKIDLWFIVKQPKNSFDICLTNSAPLKCGSLSSQNWIIFQRWQVSQFKIKQYLMAIESLEISLKYDRTFYSQYCNMRCWLYYLLSLERSGCWVLSWSWIMLLSQCVVRIFWHQMITIWKLTIKIIKSIQQTLH